MLAFRLSLIYGILLAALGAPLPAQERDFSETKKLAEAGNFTYQCNLGVMYANGNGTQKDEAEAVKWFRSSAERGGLAKAQYNLGVMYSNGRGVPKNDAEAMKWFRKAAEQDYASAQFAIGVMYSSGRGVTQNASEGAKWLRKAALQGHTKAQLSLGSRYANGSGVPKDDAEAYAWFNLAAILDEDARKRRDDLGKRLTLEQKALAQQRSTELHELMEMRKRAAGK